MKMFFEFEKEREIVRGSGEHGYKQSVTASGSGVQRGRGAVISELTKSGQQMVSREGGEFSFT